MSQQPLVDFRVRVGARPAVVPDVGIFRVFRFSAGCLKGTDHIAAPFDFNRRISVAMKNPDGDMFEFLDDRCSGVTSAANWDDRSEAIWRSTDQVPRPEAPHRKACEVDAIFINGVGFAKFIKQVRYEGQCGGGLCWKRVLVICPRHIHPLLIFRALGDHDRAFLQRLEFVGEKVLCTVNQCLLIVVSSFPCPMQK